MRTTLIIMLYNTQVRVHYILLFIYLVSSHDNIINMWYVWITLVHYIAVTMWYFYFKYR